MYKRLSSHRSLQFSAVPSTTSRVTESLSVQCWWFWGLCLVNLFPTVINICPSRCKCDDETLVVFCDAANLEVVPITLNPSVRQLHLRRNHIRLLVSALALYRELEYLDFAHNRLVSSETHAFESQSKLRVLRLGRNQMSAIINDTFFGLRELRVLELDENLIEDVPPNVFVYVPNLEELDLSRNRISNVDPEALVGLRKLKKLNLMDNRLVEIPADSLVHIGRSLVYLNVASNPLSEISGGRFLSLRVLRELSLDGCGIRELEEEVFKGLDTLRTLWLRGNPLTRIPSEAWLALDGLEELFLGENYFEEIYAGAFTGLVRLRRLEISGAPLLHTVRDGALNSCCTELHVLVISHNPKLARLEKGAFQKATNLRHLSLRDNAFRTLDENSLLWDRLESLDLRGNHLECNCSLLWLQAMLQAKGTWTSSNVEMPGSQLTTSSAAVASTSSAMAIAAHQMRNHIRCWSPSSLERRQLSELSPYDLSCYFPNARQQTVFGIAAAVIVACLATLVLLVYKYRRRMVTTLKDNWSSEHSAKKSVSYDDDEESHNSTVHVLHSPNNYNQAHHPLKCTPITEL